jgi:hypothetical protein
VITVNEYDMTTTSLYDFPHWKLAFGPWDFLPTVPVLSRLSGLNEVRLITNDYYESIGKSFGRAMIKSLVVLNGVTIKEAVVPKDHVEGYKRCRQTVQDGEVVNVVGFGISEV